MEAAADSGYKPPPEFQEDTRDALIDLNLTDSSELWLIQWPKDHIPDLDGKQVSLDLNGDGELGNIETSSGNSYKVLSFAYQKPDATVFLSSRSESKIVGKVTRRVSLVHYPEPSEIPKQDAKVRMLYERSGVTSLSKSFATPSKSIRPNRTSTHSSGRKSALSEEKEGLKSSKRKSQPSGSMDNSGKDSMRAHIGVISGDPSGQDSVHTHSGVTSTGTGKHSQEKQSKKRKKNKI